MRDELEKKLEEEFPFMRKRNGNSKKQTQEKGHVYDIYSAYGCECGDGWYELLREMCAEITKAYAEAEKPLDIIPVQIKEKFAKLRFYYDIEGHEKTVHAFDFIGEGTIRFDGADSELHKKVREIVREYEKRSGSVCENCGKSGTLWQSRNGWVSTLCGECQAERERKQAERQNKAAGTTENDT